MLGSFTTFWWEFYYAFAYYQNDDSVDDVWIEHCESYNLHIWFNGL